MKRVLASSEAPRRPLREFFDGAAGASEEYRDGFLLQGALLESGADGGGEGG